MTIDVLEQRLTDLAVETPDAGRIAARVLSLARTPRRRHFTRLLALGVATLLIAGAILYFVPAADAVLADTPVAGDLLRDAGLLGAGNRVTAVGAVSASSGYRLELVAAYADSTRTVVLLHAEPAIGLGGPGPELKDQFGRTYAWNSGTADGRTGNVILEFEPLAWPDAFTGARITLHFAAVEPYPCAIAPDDRTCKSVAGSWTLPAIIGVDEGKALPLPAAGRIGAATFRFTSVRATPATIEIDIEITGMTMDELGKIAPDGGKGTPRFSIELLGPTGESADAGSGMSEDFQGVHLRFLGLRSGPGHYRFHVSYLGSGDFDRVLTVP